MSKELHHLFKAIKDKHLEQVKDILRHHQSLVNHKDDKGKTAIIVAAQYGNSAIVDNLIKAGAHIEYQFKCGLGDKNEGYSGYCELTPLMIALYEKNDEAFQCLLKSGANPNAINECLSVSAIGAAAEQDALETVKLLLKYGADINGMPQGKENLLLICFAPLMKAASKGHYEVVEYLLQHGADPLMRDENNKSALDYAQEGNHQKIVALLQQYIK
jgi:ankyrin repeat protein